MAEIRIEYIRPGKGTTFYIEELVFMDALCLKTFKTLPPEIISALAQGMVAEGMIAPHQKAVMVAKTYFFKEHFNLLEFRDENRNLLGYYSDIGTPLATTQEGYSMTDWFLDIWLKPDGSLMELDIDEFEEAISKNLLSSQQVDQARSTFARLIEEVKNGIYPHAYL
jgi:predicted RNA-binding protein associated with RNAse of E/G family